MCAKLWGEGGSYLGASDEFPLGPLAAPDELREVRHEVSDLLCRRYYLVVRVVPLKVQGFLLYISFCTVLLLVHIVCEYRI